MYSRADSDAWLKSRQVENLAICGLGEVDHEEAKKNPALVSAE